MATEVEFHTGVADLTGFACRLLRKAHRQGAQVMVLAPEGELAEVDRRLWTQEALDFLPHVRLPAPQRVSARSPVWLAAAWPASLADAASGRVIVNLGADMPPDPAACSRIIEVVAADPEAAGAGRQRWRHYRALGLSVVHHGAA